jgi:pimeloyl-ACP methyl ester carboxylesterase
VSIYLLVHGSWHGAWCWKKVIPLLRQRRHQVLALDLPGHGEDHTRASEITLQTYVDGVRGLAEAQAEPVVLVGHSMAGIVITQTAERSSAAIQRLVYLTAILPRDGESPLELAQDNRESLLPPSLIFDEPTGTVRVKDEAIQEIFYGDCTEEDVRFARERLVPEPIAPLATPIHITRENFGRIPRTYIECLQDRNLSPAFQKRMYEASPCKKVFSMDTSHSPFFSRPQELVEHLTAP